MIFLVDYENVSNAGLKGIENLTESDSIVIFLRENSTFSAKTHIMLEKTKAKKEYIFVKIKGKNALDFQLVAYLGILCANNNKEQFCVVSNDQGFESAVKFLKARNFNVCHKSNLAMNDFAKTGCEPNNTDVDYDVKLKELLPDFAAKDIAVISEIITKYKSKQAINNNIMKVFGSDKTGEIYKKIKPLLKAKS